MRGRDRFWLWQPARAGLGGMLRLMLVVAALLVSAVARAGSVGISLEVVPPAGTTTDVFIATVRIEVAGEHGPERYIPPELEGFAIIDQQGHNTAAQQYDEELGLTSTAVEVRRYFLRATRPGLLATGRAKVRVAGQEYQSEEAVVEVRDAGAAMGPGGAAAAVPGPGHRDPSAAIDIGAPGFRPPVVPVGGPAEMFLHVAVDRERAYIGQQITVTWLLYTRDEILTFEPSLPRLDDFWSETLYEPNAYFRYAEDVVAKVPYKVVVVAKRALFAIRTGAVEIAPFAARVAHLYMPLGRAATLASAPVALEILPLPGGAPAGFDPTYVGSFSVEAEVDRARIDAGQPLTLTVTVQGRGAIRRTTPPVLQMDGFAFRAPRDFEETLYPSTSVSAGERVYRYWTTPTRSGRQEIAPIVIDYFNPATQAYEQARSRAIEIEIDSGNRGRAEAAGGASSGKGSPGIPDLPDLRAGAASRPIRTDAAPDSRGAAALHERPWLWLLAALLGLVVAGGMMAGRGRGRGRARSQSPFRPAQACLRAGRHQDFCAELSRALIELVESTLGAPVRALTREELAELLAGHGMAAAAIERMVATLERCDRGRFAPGTATAAEMEHALADARAVAQALSASRPSIRASAASASQAGR